MRGGRIILLLLAASAPALAAQTAAPTAATQDEASVVPDSIMFTVDELNEIRTRATTGGAGDDADAIAIESATLYLSTILFYGPKDWTIWLNGVPVSSGQELKSFEVTDIGPSYVELLVPLSAQGMRPVRLSPNQTFVTKSGSVVEGKWGQ